jgi:alkanesulfonate monooxygenase SsuD/methylene tetrahydromethanopterin reductase-like flavin-dependent oxidoreductase (luciferase family)
MIIPQKPWDTIQAELANHQELFREAHGTEAPRPMVGCQVFVDEDRGRAHELGEQYTLQYFKTALKHYEFAGGHFATTKGYEYYSKGAEIIQRKGEKASQQFYADLQVFGTPDECVDQIADIRDKTNAQMFIGNFNYGSFGFDEAQRNLDLFSKSVLPRVQAL